ncbi:MAG TPA: hypothetical protein PKY05_08945 [Fibrobacteria bacterium]|nr:hypothetical protein [Fibrobacteria bacterium]
MRFALVLIGSAVFSVLAFMAYRLVYVLWQNLRLDKKRLSRLKPLRDKLASGQELTHQDILPFARHPLHREPLHGWLAEQGKIHLFPESLADLVSGAESNLANWLEFPTELAACPDEIVHLNRVSIVEDSGESAHYEVFKYRVDEPHWAAKNGWMLGVVGPYSDCSEPYEFPGSTFSRVTSTVDKVSPEDEARWVHENITKRR